MKTIKPTKKRLRYLIEDEKKASAEYEKYGFKGLSADEVRHRKFLEKRLKKEGGMKKKMKKKRNVRVMQEKTKKDLKNSSKKLKSIGKKAGKETKKIVTKKFKPIYK